MPKRKSRNRKRESPWRKVPRSLGLYEWVASGTYFANVKKGGRIHRESLHTTDLAVAKRKLGDFKARLDRTDPRFGKISLVDWLEQIYFPTLRGSDSALADKQRIIDRVKETWVAAREPMRDLKASTVERWLTEQFGGWSASYYNSAVALIRDALQRAVADHVLMESPAAALKYRKRKKPIRPTPTWTQFQQIVADIRAQPFNADARASGDFVEFLGAAGVGQAEAAALTRSHVDLDSGRMVLYRFKTDTGYVVPIYPQVRELLERLCAGKKQHEHLLNQGHARKAIANACKRLGFVRQLSDGRMVPAFSHRSLRRCFITRALELGIDVQTIARWQGHRDGGKLILDTYGHVTAKHSERMAQMLTDETPANVVPLRAADRSRRK